MSPRRKKRHCHHCDYDDRQYDGGSGPPPPPPDCHPGPPPPPPPPHHRRPHGPRPRPGEDLELMRWRDHRDEWLAANGYNHVDDLYIEKRLEEEFPGFFLCSREEIGARWKGDVSEELLAEAERLGCDIRFYRPTQAPCLALKVPREFASSRFARWAVKVS